MEQKKQDILGFLLSALILSLIIALGPYLTLKSTPALGVLLELVL